MIIGVCTIELFLPDNDSLKDKRQVLKSLKDRLKQRFNVSVAEVDDQDLWQKTVIGVACVGNQKDHVNSVLDKVIGAVRGTPRVELIDYRLELI
ncbi:MAG TPA: DUF503 domain-containing protein [Nitrospiria bacterium]|nr:DUF503 domain-containing protein [Nitrospiria bacterium]